MITPADDRRAIHCVLHDPTADNLTVPCEAVDAIAREHLADVKRKLAALAALRRELDSLIGQCRHGTVAECRILEALAPDVQQGP